MIEKINDVTDAILFKTLHINTYFDYDGDIFGVDIDNDDYYMGRQDLYELCLKSSKIENGYRYEVLNWHSQSMCLTGLHFQKHFDVLSSDIRNYSINYPAYIKDGIGIRYLYRALGNRSLTVNLSTERDTSSAGMNDDEVETGRVNHVSVSFTHETLAEQKGLLAELEQEKKRLDKQLLLSELSNNYKNFHTISGLEPADFNKSFLPNPKFKELFDEQ